MGQAYFTGNYPLKIDGKGRLLIPADFRRVLDLDDSEREKDSFPALFVVFGEHLTKFLEVYSVASFTSVLGEIRALPRGSDRRKLLEDLIVEKSQRLEVDRDGRIVLPARVRDILGAREGEVVLTGANDHFKIWRAEEHAAKDGAMKARMADFGPDFDPMSLLGGGAD